VEHVDVDGMPIAYTRAGSGPALVMLHGAPSDSRTWQWMVPDLSRDHTVIAWDAPGFGESSDIDDSWRAPQFADALAAFVAVLGLERPHLVGHSFGTMVALSLFRRHPAVPASLVLVGGYAGWAGSLTPDEVARRLEMFVGMAELGDAFDPKSYPGLFSDLIPADRDAALATMMRENIRPATIRAAGHIGAETDLRSGMARPMLGRRSRTPRPSMPRSRHRSSLCFRSSATRVWSRTPKRARRRSAGS
jgi:pimeloyl-ACP methyl ester carboxylesterase